MLRRQETRAGLEVLERVLGERPAWAPALGAYAGALLRSGRFAEAADGYATLLGDGRARALGRGELSARDLDRPVDPEHVLGLAVARHYLGEHRVADRLYRAYADLVDPISERAARAYWRLGEMFDAADVSWGDAAAERAKAIAVDPAIETRIVLPDLPDVESIPETEPYTREIALAPDRPAPEGALASLPVLIRWVGPEFEDVDADAEWERSAVEILVGGNGRAGDVALPSELDLGSGPGAALAGAAGEWCFEPALGESAAVATWIIFEVEVPAAAAPDSLAAAEPETVPGGEPDPEDAGTGAPGDAGARKKGKEPKR
jgi:hypothetical protein